MLSDLVPENGVLYHAARELSCSVAIPSLEEDTDTEAQWISDFAEKYEMNDDDVLLLVALTNYARYENAEDLNDFEVLNDGSFEDLCVAESVYRAVHTDVSFESMMKAISLHLYQKAGTEETKASLEEKLTRWALDKSLPSQHNPQE